jgi:hypothetical protein
MAEFVLPDSRDVKTVIADYCDTLTRKGESSEEREKIIANCEEPFVLLINAWEMVGARGERERQIWSAFMRDIAFDKRTAEH